MKKIRLSFIRFNISLCVIFLFYIVPSPVLAQQNMIVEHYTHDEGLISNTVYSVLQDKDDFMWFGTWHGLCSFDGIRFTPYVAHSNQKSDLPPRKVRDMVEDGNGHLWICNTDNHLYMFDKNKETYHDLYRELKRKTSNVQVIKIQLLSNGRVFLLTRNKDIFEAYTSNDGKIHINSVYNAHTNINATTMKLCHDVVGETSKYVFWLNRKMELETVVKTTSKRLLPNGVGRLTCLHKSGKDIYVGTDNGHIYLISNNNSAKCVYRPSGDNIKAITSIDRIGKCLYFTSGKTLYAVEHNNSEYLIANLNSTIFKTFIDHNKKLWLCTNNEQLAYYDTRLCRFQRFFLSTGTQFNDIKFCDARNNGLFILTRTGEVWRFDNFTGVMQNINYTPEFNTFVSKPHYYDISLDRNGMLWMASTGGGIYKVGFLNNNFKLSYSNLLSQKNISENDGIRAIYQDKHGDLWLSTRHGTLYCIDGRSYAVKRQYEKTDIGIVYNIMEDKDGHYWFSTKGSGLVMASIDKDAPHGLKLTRYTNVVGDKYSLSSNRVYYTFQDSKARIWVCTFNGGLNLMTVRAGKVKFINKYSGFRFYPKYELYGDVRNIVEDKNGRIWVGTTDGLMSFDSRFKRPEDIRFETYREYPNTGITCNDILSLFKDSSSRLWLGIFGSGLYQLTGYDSEKQIPLLRHYPINGTSGDVITSIIEDKSKCLWICTENGLASLPYGSIYLKTYDTFAGLPHVDIEENTSTCLNNGFIFIGTRQGVLSINPSKVRKANNKHLQTYISAFKVANKNLSDYDPPIYAGSLKYAKGITLKHNFSTFTIEFTSPNYTNNTLMQYAYILDGYEKEWHNSGNNRVATYANVPPGHYKFRVKVNDGVSEERVLDITITPPWWRTWWAYALYFVVFALCVYGVLRLVLYMIKIRNEVYINDRLAELKIRFFTNVSHELRTPLALIKGPIDELKSNESLSDSGKEYIELIDRNANKMLQLVNQILDFRKVQNGKMKMHVSFTDIGAIIDLLMRDFRMLANERNIKFTLDKPNARVLAWCDAKKIAVVINNLLSNAFKYTNDGGTVEIKLGLDLERELCTVSVVDDGVNIPKAQMEQIFERFSQVESNTSESMSQAGTGIGLALSREFMNMHHGKIWAENRDDANGVKFTIEFPVGRENFVSGEYEVYFDDQTAIVSSQSDTSSESTFVDTETSDANSSDRATIILVEDNVDLCHMLKLRLCNDYNVFVAHDGEAGIKAIYEYHPDLIITDLMMPIMDGLELLQRVRHDFNISHTPVIVLTAKNTDDDRMAAVRMGANAYITKPFSTTYLVARINQLLEEQRIFQRKMVIQNNVDNSMEEEQDSYSQHLIKKDIEFVKRIHAIIEENLNTSDFNIDSIAESIGLSRSAFFKKLKSLTGFAPVDLVKEIRLNKAAKMIENTDENMAEIAYAVGFRDAGYFGKCFRKKYGMTPKEYRLSKSSDKRIVGDKE